VIDIPTTGTATTLHFDPTQVAQLSLQVDFQRGIVTIQTQAAETEAKAETDQAEQTIHNTGELEQCALTQALLEQQLPHLFATVLEIPVEQVASSTDFFEYGGDSLAMAALLTAIEEQFKLKLAPDLIFDHPVLENLIAAITRSQQTQPTTNEREVVLA
jgi:acyl carrier protein